jgi:hypothetical protein
MWEIFDPSIESMEFIKNQVLLAQQIDNAISVTLGIYYFLIPWYHEFCYSVSECLVMNRVACDHRNKLGLR